MKFLLIYSAQAPAGLVEGVYLCNDANFKGFFVVQTLNNLVYHFDTNTAIYFSAGERFRKDHSDRNENRSVAPRWQLLG